MISIQDMEVLQPLGLGVAIRLRCLTYAPLRPRESVSLGARRRFQVEQTPRAIDGTLDDANWGPFESGPGEFVSIFATREEAVAFMRGILAGIGVQA